MDTTWHGTIIGSHDRKSPVTELMPTCLVPMHEMPVCLLESQIQASDMACRSVGCLGWKAYSVTRKKKESKKVNTKESV